MYWEREQEQYLLTLILENLDPEEHSNTADQIISGLIEMGLVDAERAPVAQRFWQDNWDGLGVSMGFIVGHYVTRDEMEDEDGPICAHCDTEITSNGYDWVDETGSTVCAQMSADGPTNRLHVPA